MNNGFITLHRKFMEWEWYDDHNTKILFLHLLLKANHAPKKWRGETIERGQHLTGLYKLAEETGLTQQKLRTSIEKLKSTGEITSKSTNKYRVITLVKYSDYQDINNDTNKQDNKQITNKQQASNKQITTNNNDNNVTIKTKKDMKHKHGEYKNVLLTDKQLDKLKVDYPNKWESMIKGLDEGIQLKGYKYKDHNLAMRKWAKNTPVSKEKETQYTREIDVSSLIIQ